MKKIIIILSLFSLLFLGGYNIYKAFFTFESVGTTTHNIEEIENIQIDENKDGVTLFLYDIAGIKSFTIETFENENGTTKNVLVDTNTLSIEDMEKLEEYKQLFEELSKISKK